jgi:hypothetical protein
MLIMDQKSTTQPVLGELDARSVKFATLRMRSPALVNYINGLTAKDLQTVTLDRPGRYNTPRVHEDAAVKLTKYPGTVRQLHLVPAAAGLAAGQGGGQHRGACPPLRGRARFRGGGRRRARPWRPAEK